MMSHCSTLPSSLITLLWTQVTAYYQNNYYCHSNSVVRITTKVPIGVTNTIFCINAATRSAKHSSTKDKKCTRSHPNCTSSASLLSFWQLFHSKSLARHQKRQMIGRMMSWVWGSRGDWHNSCSCSKRRRKNEITLMITLTFSSHLNCSTSIVYIPWKCKAIWGLAVPPHTFL